MSARGDAELRALAKEAQAMRASLPQSLRMESGMSASNNIRSSNIGGVKCPEEEQGK